MKPTPDIGTTVAIHGNVFEVKPEPRDGCFGCSLNNFGIERYEGCGDYLCNGVVFVKRDAVDPVKALKGLMDPRDAVTKPAKRPILPTDAATRKATPITTGVIDYFPLALAEVAKCSKVGNDQHNPGQALHWDKTKSMDHADCIARHLLDRGTVDNDGIKHSAKLAWRALALLQLELEAGG